MTLSSRTQLRRLLEKIRYRDLHLNPLLMAHCHYGPSHMTPRKVQTPIYRPNHVICGGEFFKEIPRLVTGKMRAMLRPQCLTLLLSITTITRSINQVNLRVGGLCSKYMEERVAPGRVLVWE